MTSRRSLRRTMRRRRRALSSAQRACYARRLTRYLANHPAFRTARHIAVYLPNDGEMDLTPLIRRAWRMHKRCYLPVLRPFGKHLWFLPYTPHTPLRRNRFGIPEPRKLSPVRAPWSLDLALTPLVAFDRQGNRLGMGGGYYDRTFAYLHKRKLRKRPRLLGVAYSFQETPALPAEPWDVPLWGVVTEQGLREVMHRL